MMLALLTPVILVAACSGGGRGLLRLMGVDQYCSRDEVRAVAFALGFGFLGWAVSILGIIGRISQTDILLLVGTLSLGLLLPLRSRGQISEEPLGFFIILIATAAAIFAGLEAISPPTDADTLAYHFALPKQFLATGRIEFVPRAVDGAIPLLIQMTYLAALGLGGEMGLTLWTMVAGLAVGYLTFAVACRFLPHNWAALTGLLLYTTPAFVYGAGGGQVEVRLCLFILVASLAAVESAQRGSLGWAAIAGIAAGFAAGGKFTGLLVVAVTPILLLEHQRRIGLIIVYSLFAGIFGCQWYLWNFLHSGDPIFPLLSSFLGYPAPEIWNEPQNKIFREGWNVSEIATPQNLIWFFTYPLAALIAPLQAFEAGRTGFGPWLWIVIPFALIGCWQRRDNLKKSPLTRFAFLSVVYYLIWFFVGPSQRLRHLLPYLPLVLIPLTVAAHRCCGVDRKPLILAVAISLGIQVTGQAFYSLRYARYLLSADTREEFLSQNISGFAAARWINTHLTPSDRVMTPWRPILFLLDVPYYYAHPHLQALVNLLSTSSVQFMQEVKTLGITHFLSFTDLRENKGGPQGALVRGLLTDGCAVLAAEIDVTLVESRTLFQGGIPTKAYVLKLQADQCGNAQ